MADARPPPTPLPEAWLIEPPPVLEHTRHPLSAFQALLLSRRSLVQLMTLSSGILLVHLFASRNSPRGQAPKATSMENGFLEKPWPPRSEGRKSMSYVGFTAILTAAALLLKALVIHTEINLWPGLHDHFPFRMCILMYATDLGYFEVGVISLFYQFTLYVSLRLARQGFTLGELGLVSHGATALFMEVVNLTIAKVCSSNLIVQLL